MKLGEIVEIEGKKYVVTNAGLVKIGKNVRPKPIFEQDEIIKAFQTGEKTIVELVKTKVMRGEKAETFYILRKRVQLKDRDIVSKAIGVSEEIAKKLFQL